MKADSGLGRSLSVLLGWACACNALAVTVTWDGGPDGTGTNWNEATNWNGDALPGGGDVARFTTTGIANGKLLLLGTSQSVDRVVFDGMSVGFTIGGASDVAAGHILSLNHVFRQSNVGGIQVIAAEVVLRTNSVWDVHAGYNNNVTVTRAIHGQGMSLEKNNTGTLILGGTNTYSGGTTVRQGTLELGFSQGAAPVTDILAPGALLAMHGGSVTVRGKAGTINSQTVGGLDLNLGAATLNIINAHATSNKTRLSLGGITRSTGGTVNFVQPTVNTTVSSENGYVTTNANDVSGIIGAYAVVGAANWAANNGVNVVAYTGYTTLSGDAPDIIGEATSHVQINNGSTGDVGLGASVVNVHTVKAADTASRTLVVGSGKVLRLGKVGGILTPSGTGAFTIEGGTLTAGGAADAAGEIVFQNATVITNSATLADNGSGPVVLTKSGAGTLVLTVPATYTGGTVVNAGTLLLPSGLNPLDTNGTITVTGGTLNLNGAVQTNTSEVVFIGGGVTNGSLAKLGTDYVARSGVIRTKLEGPVGLVKTTVGALTVSGANTYTGDTRILEGSASFTGSAIVKGALFVGSPDGTLPASVSCVNTPLTETKPWTVYPNGSLNLGSSAQYLGAKLTIIGGSVSGTQPYFQSGSSVEMTGGTLGANIYGANNFSVTTFAAPTPAVVSGTIRKTHTFTVADGPAHHDAILSGTHAGTGLIKVGAGVMTLTGGANTYTGSTTVNAGTLLVDNVSGSGVGNSAVSVAAGATLGGRGFIGGVAGYGVANVSVGGSAGNPAVVAPGSTDRGTGAHLVGTLTVGNLAAQTNNVTFGANSKLRLTIDAAGNCDRLAVNGTLSLATATDTLELDVADADALPAGVYTLVTFQQLAAPGQVFDTVEGLPSRGILVYSANAIEYQINAKGTMIKIR